MVVMEAVSDFGPPRGNIKMASKFSTKLKELRVSKGRTLREFCLENKIDPGNYSKLERGHFPPPESHDLLEKYAMALGLKPGSDDWLELFDLAAAERGRIPEDLMSDEKIVDKLPVLFRTMRGTPLSGEQLDELIEHVRRS
ncbi:MAG: helix-turn-helix transcriptional regulator [Pirellulaceae bacterium]|nr:helix-turn-helix transcriptional regulator [Pirellulaceae bacterium]